MKSDSMKRVAIAGLLLAMNVALSSFGLPVPGGHLYLCDVVICTAALLLDPFSAFLVGGVGSFIGDLLFYPPPMFVSLITHGLQAVVIAFLSRSKRGKRSLPKDALAVAVGGVIMVVGYSLGRAFVYATPAYALVKLPFEILQAACGAFSLLLIHRLKLREKLYLGQR